MPSIKDYYEEYWRRPGMATFRDPLSEPRQRLVWAHLESASEEKGRLLDIGCGRGELVAAATERGHDAIGMDVSGEGLAIARRSFPDCQFVEHGVEDRPWPFEAGSFDLVTSFEVIEHLLRPAELLKGAFEVLRPGGHLVLSTPYHGWLKNLALVTLAFDWHFGVEGDHIRFFSDRALRRILTDNGFEIEGIKHLGRVPGLWKVSFVWARKR